MDSSPPDYAVNSALRSAARIGCVGFVLDNEWDWRAPITLSKTGEPVHSRSGAQRLPNYDTSSTAGRRLMNKNTASWYQELHDACVAANQLKGPILAHVTIFLNGRHERVNGLLIPESETIKWQPLKPSTTPPPFWMTHTQSYIITRKSSYGGLKIASDSYVVCICGMTLNEVTGSRMPDIVRFLDKHAQAARDVIVVSYDRLNDEKAEKIMTKVENYTITLLAVKATIDVSQPYLKDAMEAAYEKYEICGKVVDAAFSDWSSAAWKITVPKPCDNTILYLKVGGFVHVVEDVSLRPLSRLDPMANALSDVNYPDYYVPNLSGGRYHQDIEKEYYTRVYFDEITAVLHIATIERCRERYMIDSPRARSMHPELSADEPVLNEMPPVAVRSRESVKDYTQSPPAKHARSDAF